MTGGSQGRSHTPVALMLAVLLGVSACAARETEDRGVVEPELESSVAPENVATPELRVDAEAGAPTSTSGDVLKELGEPATILDAATGDLLFSLTVSEIEVRDDCPGSFARAPENGQYVVVHIVAAFPLSAADHIPVDAENGEVLMFLGPGMFSIVDDSGVVHETLETDAAWTCFETHERAAYTIAPGEEVAGMVVLDSPVPSGTLVYRPVGNEGWQWAF